VSVGRVQYGLSTALVALAQSAIANGYQVGLFTNNHTPAVTDGLSAFTEASFFGYERQTLTSWLVPSFDATSGTYTLQYGGVLFEGADSSDQEVYGYLVIGPGNLLIAANVLAGGPYPCGTPAHPIVIIASEQLGNSP